MLDHDHWVNMLALPAGVLEECPEGGFVTGCLDKRARVLVPDRAEATRVRLLDGHDGGVISLAGPPAARSSPARGRHGAAVGPRAAAASRALRGHENGVCVLGRRRATSRPARPGARRTTRSSASRCACGTTRSRPGGAAAAGAQQPRGAQADHLGPCATSTPCPSRRLLSSSDGTLRVRAADDGAALATLAPPSAAGGTRSCWRLLPRASSSRRARTASRPCGAPPARCCRRSRTRAGCGSREPRRRPRRAARTTSRASSRATPRRGRRGAARPPGSGRRAAARPRRARARRRPGRGAPGVGLARGARRRGGGQGADVLARGQGDRRAVVRGLGLLIEIGG